MASLYKKVISGRPYWYLREMGWVDGKPKLVSERYLGTAAEIEALLDAREAAVVPDRARHLAFGAVAAVWGLLADLDLAGLIDQHVPAVSGLALTPGTYLALAVANRVVDPCSKNGFADWWKTTAADRFTKISASALDHRRFWDAMHAIPADALPRIEHALALRVCEAFGVDTRSVALDMVVLDTPSLPSKRAATCGNATPRRSLTFRVQPRIVNHRLTAAGSKKVCGERWRVTSGPGGSTDALGCAA